MENPADFGIPSGANDGWGPNAMLTVGYAIQPERRRMAIGLDLGTLQDSTVMVCMESVESPEVDCDGKPVVGPDLVQKLSRPIYQIRLIKRLPLGLSYPMIAAQVALVMSNPECRNAQLVLDRTCVGVPTQDIFESAGLSPIGITSTGSTQEGKLDHGGVNYSVGKLALVSRLQAELQCGRLKFPPVSELPEIKIFLDELRNFSVRVSDTGHASFGAAGSGHDDSVSAACLALWWLAPRTGNDWQAETIDF